MPVTVHSDTKYGDITRIAVIAGASNSNSRGLRVFEDASAYSMMASGGTLQLMFKGFDEVDPKHKKSVAKTGHKIKAKKSKIPQCPILVTMEGGSSYEEDVIWYVLFLSRE